MLTLAVDDRCKTAEMRYWQSRPNTIQMEIDEEPTETLSIAGSAGTMISVLQRVTVSSLRTRIFLNSLLAANRSKRGRRACNPIIVGGVPLTCYLFLIVAQVHGRKNYACLTGKSIRPRWQSETTERGPRCAGEAVAPI